MFKSAKSKVGLGVIIFGIISIIITQSADNGTSFGQSLLVASVFFVIGAVLVFVGNKKTDNQTPQSSNEKFVSVKDRYPAGTVFTYPNSSVYHTDYYCSSGRADNDPEALSEDKAIQKGLVKCKRCQEYTCFKK